MKTNLMKRFYISGFLGLILLFPVSAQQQKPSVTEDPFKPTDESLKQYQYPEWFRDAKFGIWSHWGPQAVPRQGDWYAKRLYQEGTPGYKYHVEHYGHPSEFGYKDIIPLWKAERWDPDMLNILEEIGIWTSANGEGIYGSRPWKVYGEKPANKATAKLDRFDENFGFSSNDIRFTSKGNTLYAYCLGKPEADIIIKSLAKSSKLTNNAIASVSMIGSKEKLSWKQSADALVIKKPINMPAWQVIGFKIDLL